MEREGQEETFGMAGGGRGIYRLNSREVYDILDKPRENISETLGERERPCAAQRPKD
jgi:hypothetical protein